MTFNAARALSLLRTGSGQANATFRDGQEEAMRHVVEGRGRLLVVQKTGWGKSFVYFIATKLLREAGHGPALLISPLLSLMRNQIAAAERMGVRAATIHSDNKTEWSVIEDQLRNDQIDILLISPERLANERFVAEVLAPIAATVSLFVVDEAHCISDWGHDFRPHYRLIERIARTLPANVRLLATTATANNRVMADLEQVLGPNLHVSRGDLHRPSLRLQCIRLPGQAERLAWLAANLPRLPGSGIVYTLTVHDAQEVAAWLTTKGITAQAYFGASENRPELEQSLLENRIKVLVATTALGMGFDKPDLAFVVHYQTPGSVVAYYQQVGRAGRALPTAYGVLLSGTEENRINEFFIESAFPSRAEVEQVLSALASIGEPASMGDLLGLLNLSMGRIEKALALLSLESPAPVVKQNGKWQLTAAQVSEHFWQRAARLTALRRDEQEQMQAYTRLSTGNMEYLIKALDGDARHIVEAPLPALPASVDDGLVREAVAFLRRTSLPFEPRKEWSSGMDKYGVRGRISAAHLAQPGRALCLWGDAGWGALVRDGKYRDGRFDDQLVGACVALLRAWAPEPFPSWVTCVPSLRHPHLVPDFAARLASALGLPFAVTLIKSDARPEQKSMANSTQQARNVDGSLAMAMTVVPPGPVLLLDDMVDSRWTLTVAAWLLRTHGSGEVWPLALGLTGGGE